MRAHDSESAPFSMQEYYYEVDMPVSAYLFEVRYIQRFIFATGKLRDASAASEIVDYISGEVLTPTDKEYKENSPENWEKQVVAVTGLAGKLIGSTLDNKANIYRAAGGVLDLTHESEEQLKLFRAAFRVALASHAPGLVFNDCIATFDINNADGHEDTQARIKARNKISRGGPLRGVTLPLGSPIVRPAPRSGGSPAVLSGMTSDEGRCRITREYADLPTLAKRRFLRPDAPRLPKKFSSNGTGEQSPLRWPTVLSNDEDSEAEKKEADNIVFPFDNSTIPRIAVLHADGNGMGNLFAKAVKELNPEQIRHLSIALGKATQDAVREAMEPVIARRSKDGIVPARPVLLGGDDVSILLRADLAVNFALDFVRCYESMATAAVSKFISSGHLTTKVGFVVIGPHQPFAQAYTLAESLATAARNESESRIAFYRVAGSTIAQDAKALEEQGRAAEHFTLWRSSHDAEQLKALCGLARLLGHDDVGRGALRRVPEILRTSRSEADRLHDKALASITARNPDVRDKLDKALTAVGMPDLSKPVSEVNPAWCPLLQAHDLMHIGGGPL